MQFFHFHDVILQILNGLCLSLKQLRVYLILLEPFEFFLIQIIHFLI